MIRLLAPATTPPSRIVMPNGMWSVTTATAAV
jgi:hypothetical protein